MCHGRTGIVSAHLCLQHFMLLSIVTATITTFLCRLTVPIFQAISYEYTVEMTYPIPEATSASVLNAFSQVSTLSESCDSSTLFISLSSAVGQYWNDQCSSAICYTGYWCLQ